MLFLIFFWEAYACASIMRIIDVQNTRCKTHQAYIGNTCFLMLSMKVLQWNQTLAAKLNRSDLQEPLTEMRRFVIRQHYRRRACAPEGVRTWWYYSYQECLIDRQLKVAVAFETDAFTFTYMFAILLGTHIVTETYAFLHIPPVLANCRQSNVGKFRSLW